MSKFGNVSIRQCVNWAMCQLDNVSIGQWENGNTDDADMKN
jgi:hypothetical protein